MYVMDKKRLRKMIPLVIADKSPRFLLNITNPDTTVAMSFEVYEIVGWDYINEDVADDVELYLSGMIKWDGCSHLMFGKKDENGKTNGYLHLCGKEFFNHHIQLMKELFEYASKVIVKFDNFYLF